MGEIRRNNELNIKSTYYILNMSKSFSLKLGHFLYSDRKIIFLIEKFFKISYTCIIIWTL